MLKYLNYNKYIFLYNIKFVLILLFYFDIYRKVDVLYRCKNIKEVIMNLKMVLLCFFFLLLYFVKHYAYSLCLLGVMFIVYAKIAFMLVVFKAYVCVKLCCAIQ